MLNLTELVAHWGYWAILLVLVAGNVGAVDFVRASCFFAGFLHVAVGEANKGIEVICFICDDKKLVFGLEASGTGSSTR
jgi:hypothetical protein